MSSPASSIPDGYGSLVEWWGCYLKILEEDVAVFLTLSWVRWGARTVLAGDGRRVWCAGEYPSLWPGDGKGCERGVV